MRLPNADDRDLRTARGENTRLGLGVSIATAALLLALDVLRPAVLRSEENDVLWFKHRVENLQVAAQLHPGGYAWMLVRGGDAHDVWGDLKVALRMRPGLYEELRQVFEKDARLGSGGLYECPSFLLGRAPPILLMRPVYNNYSICQDSENVLDRFEKSLLPARESLLDAWTRVHDAAKAIVAERVLTAHVELEVTLAAREGRLQDAGKLDPVISPELIEALRGGPWAKGAALLRYAISSSAGGSSVTVTYPATTTLSINGVALEGKTPFVPVLAPGRSTARMKGWIGNGVRRFQAGAGPPARVEIYTPTSLWFPAALWSDAPDIDIRYSVAKRVVAQARLRRADQPMRVCGPDHACSEVALDDARGLAARALGECRASVAELRRLPSNGPKSPKLSVRIAGETCTLDFAGRCLAEHRRDLDHLIAQLLAHRSNDKRPQLPPEYPICAGSQPKPFECGTE